MADNEEKMSNGDAVEYLTNLLNKQLLVTTKDNRLFLGSLKCTDKAGGVPALKAHVQYPNSSHNALLTHQSSQTNTTQDRNIILSQTYEYREPSAAAIAAAASASLKSSTNGSSDKVEAEMTSRYLGLTTIPGDAIVKICLQEFESQKRKG